MLKRILGCPAVVGWFGQICHVHAEAVWSVVKVLVYIQSISAMKASSPGPHLRQEANPLPNIHTRLSGSLCLYFSAMAWELFISVNSQD